MSIPQHYRFRARICLLIIVVLIIYGSLYPFDFVRPPSIVQAWQAMWSDWRMWTNFPDVLGNALLFVPFGAVCYFAFGRQVSWIKTLLIIMLALLFALAVQITQIFTTDRDASLSDAFWNTMGTITSYGVTILFMRSRFMLRPHNKIDWPPLLLVVCWFCSETVPFVPTLDVQKIKDALKPLLHFTDINLVRALSLGVAMTMVWELLNAAFRERQIMQKFAGVVALMLLAKVVVVWHSISYQTVLACLLAMVLVAWIQKLDAGYRRKMLFALLLAAFTLSELYPFSLRSIPSHINWMPFSAMLEGNMLINVDSLIGSLFLYASLAWLIRKQGGSPLLVSLLLAVWIGLLEWSQQWIVGRTADMTEPVLMIGMGWLFKQHGAKNVNETSHDNG